jgi:pyruvate, water dikinase
VILPFTDPACQDVGVAGGKGASLAAATAQGLPVPPGWVVCSSAFEQAVGARADELRALARAHDHEGSMALVGELARPDLGEAFAALGATRVAVRSSAVAEDSNAASFAGQQETYLGVPDAATAAERVVDCWASFFSERALFYRSRKGSLDDLRMAVVIQRMVAADVSGVLFTIDPVARRRDQMVVEAVFGLGEPAVSGELTPDNYTMKRDGTVKRRRIVTQPWALIGGEHVDLSPEDGARETLGDDDLARLAELGRALEERNGSPQDIEWAISAGALYVLQSRPVTTL